ncbi:hypothetical protein I4U23_022035 [Adineta vaga]|nr:hypothetical protein I4U23_022035 [Adineta vaga]
MIFIGILIIISLSFDLIKCDINWNGNNWAFACDFKGNNLSNVRIPGEQCGGKCTRTPQCTHFVWTTSNGGTCWMKKGAVSKKDAIATNDRNMVCGVMKSKSTEKPFYIIAHMANSKFAVDWAVKQGANAIECDLRFDTNGNPSAIDHGPGCDCECAKGNDHICIALQNQCSGPASRENPAVYMQNVARHNSIGLYFVDSKVGGFSEERLVKAGKALIPFMDKNLFGYGYKGAVVISSASFSTFAYVRSAAIAAKSSRNANHYFFTIDQEENNYAGVMNKLYPYTNNRVYGTGRGSCGEGETYYTAIETAVAGKKQGENGMNYIYTVDQEEIMRQYIKHGVDGIMTNQIALAKKVAISMGLRLAHLSDRISISKKREYESFYYNNTAKTSDEFDLVTNTYLPWIDILSLLSKMNCY